MTFETDGKIFVKGDDAPGVAVHIHAERHGLVLFKDDEEFARFDRPDLRISALTEGFAIRYAGEDFVLKADDDVGLAEELGLAAATPRLARKMAAAHNTTERARPEPPPEVRSQFGAVLYGVAGILIISGGTLLQTSEFVLDIADPWVAFLLAGTVMIGVAWLMTRNWRWPDWLAFAVLGGISVLFALAVREGFGGGIETPAYGLVAGGLVLGAAGAATSHTTH